MLYLKQAKFIFFVYKMGEQEGETGPGGDTSGRVEEVGKGRGRVNMIQILCTHVYTCKNDTC
jgi:hypothetical protein